MGARLILIVEDHDATRAALQRLFRRMGFDVLAVGTIREGLAALDLRPDYAVVDLELPDGYGSEIVTRARSEGLPTKVVVCTGCGDSTWIEAVGQLGPQAVLPKPVAFDDLCRSCQIA